MPRAATITKSLYRLDGTTTTAGLCASIDTLSTPSASAMSATKLLHRLAARRSPGADTMAEGQGPVDEPFDSGSFSESSLPLKQDMAANSYAHSYYATIREMGLPIDNPNNNARRTYLLQSKKNDRPTTVGTVPMDEEKDVDSSQRLSGNRSGKSRVAISAKREKSRTAEEHRSRRGDRARTPDQYRRSNPAKNSIGVPTARQARRTPDPSRSTDAQTRSRSRSPSKIRLATSTRSSARRYHTPEAVRHSPSPASTAHSDEWRKLTDWLDNLKFKKYAGLLRRSGITTLKHLETLTLADLADIGIADRDMPILQFKIKELQHLTRSLSKKSDLQHSFSSSSSDNRDEANEYWDRVSTRVSDVGIHENDETHQSYGGGMQDMRQRNGSPVGTSSTMAATRIGIPQNFFELHGPHPSSVRVPERVKMRPRNSVNSFVEYSSRDGNNSRSTIRSERDSARKSTRNKVVVPTSASRRRYHSPEDLRPSRGLAVHVSSSTENGNDEWIQIREWLESLKLSKYEGIFLRSGITKLKYVKSLTQYDLNQMGIRNNNDYPAIVLSAKKLVLPKRHIQSNDICSNRAAEWFDTARLNEQAVRNEFTPAAVTARSSDQYHHETRLFSQSSPERSRSAPRLGRSTVTAAQDSFYSRDDIYNLVKDSSAVDNTFPRSHDNFCPVDNLTDNNRESIFATGDKSSVDQLLDAFWAGDEVLFYRIWTNVVDDTVNYPDVASAILQASHLLELFSRVYFVTFPQRWNRDNDVVSVEKARTRFRLYVDKILAAPDRYCTLLKSKEFVTFVGIGMLPDAASNATYSSIFKPEWANGLARRLESFVTRVLSTPSLFSALRQQKPRDYSRENLTPVSPTVLHDTDDTVEPIREFLLGGEANSFHSRSSTMEEDFELKAGGSAAAPCEHIRNIDEKSVYRLDGRLYSIDQPAGSPTSLGNANPPCDDLLQLNTNLQNCAADNYAKPTQNLTNELSVVDPVTEHITEELEGSSSGTVTEQPLARDQRRVNFADTPQDVDSRINVPMSENTPSDISVDPGVEDVAEGLDVSSGGKAKVEHKPIDQRSVNFTDTTEDVDNEICVIPPGVDDIADGLVASSGGVERGERRPIDQRSVDFVIPAVGSSVEDIAEAPEGSSNGTSTSENPECRMPSLSESASQGYSDRDLRDAMSLKTSTNISQELGSKARSDGRVVSPTETATSIVPPPVDAEKLVSAASEINISNSLSDSGCGTVIDSTSELTDCFSMGDID